MAQAWSVLLPDLLPHLSGCPTVVVEHEAKRAAQQFFADTYAWKVTEAAVAVASGTETVTIAPADAGQELVRIEEIRYDDKILDDTTPEELAADYGDTWQDDTGTPIFCIQDTPGVLRLYPIPDADATTGIVVRLSVKPSEAATGIPDELMREHRMALIYGTKSRLLAYKDKPWTDYQLAGASGVAFQSAIDSANFKAAMSHGKSSRIAARPKWC